MNQRRSKKQFLKKNMIHCKVLLNYKQCTKEGIKEAGIPNIPSFKFRILINNKEGY